MKRTFHADQENNLTRKNISRNGVMTTIKELEKLRGFLPLVFTCTKIIRGFLPRVDTIWLR